MADGLNTKAKVRQISKRAFWVAVAVSVLFFAGFVFFLTRTLDSKNALDSGEVAGTSGRVEWTTPFRGTSYESSGVIYVPGSNGVLFVDDSRAGEVFWTQLDEAGKQVGEVESIFTDSIVDDPESITFDGSFFYVLGSQSEPKAGKNNALIRFRFDANTRKITGLERLEGLRDFLLNNITELKGAGDKPGSDGGLDVEGIAWHPDNKVFMLAMRSPLAGDQALLFPIRLKDSTAPLSVGNIETVERQAIKLRLGDLGVQDIQYDSRLKSYLIIAGAPKDREKGNFSLWRWDGKPGEAGLRKISGLDPRLKPEGITRVEIRGSDYLFFVFDSSSYAKLDYSSLDGN
jgi:hypothetical protein